jgi:hypothetical protein
MRGKPCVQACHIFDVSAGGLDYHALEDRVASCAAQRLSDLVATVIDLLDERVLYPSAGTTRTPEGTQVRVSMSFDTTDRWVAAERAVAVLPEVFDEAVPEVAARGLVFSAA